MICCKTVMFLTDYEHMNKANGGDRIPVELFQILEDDAMKVLHSIRQQIWKTHPREQCMLSHVIRAC